MADDPTTVLTPEGEAPPPAAEAPAVPATEAPPPAAEAKPAEAETKPAAPVVPEKYEFKVADGVELDPKVVEAATPIFKELGLTQEQAQRLVDFQTQVNVDLATRQADAWTRQNEQWVEAAKADKELGGAKFGENVALAVKAVNALATPELKEYLTASGAGNHPEVIRLFAKLGRLVGDDKLSFGGAPAVGEKSAAELFYPSMSR